MANKKPKQISLGFDFQDHQEFGTVSGEDKEFMDKLSWQFEERFPKGTYAYCYWRESGGKRIFNVLTTKGSKRKSSYGASYLMNYDKDHGIYGFSFGEGEIKKPVLEVIRKVRKEGLEVKKYYIN